MKTITQQVLASMVAPPGETMRDTLSERRSAAHWKDPMLHWQRSPREHDNRRAVVATGAVQHIRARQTEPRTAETCHVRTHRRPAGK